MNKTPQDWLDTYYPTRANSLEAKAAPAAHSLRKWRGLLPEVLREHGLCIEAYELINTTGDSILTIDDETCALCQVYQQPVEDGCIGCYLYEIRGGRRCDIPTPEEVGSSRKSPYEMLCCYKDPYPMINLLEKAVAMEKMEGK